MAITNVNVTGLVIGDYDYKESSKILRIFTRELGIISVMARGAKRPKSKLQNLSSLYCLAEYSLVKRKDFYYLDEGKIITINLHLRNDIKSLYSAQLCIELINKSLLEDQISPDLFDLLVKTIEYLGQTDNKLRLVSMFVIKYISMIGYRPELMTCAICKKTPRDVGFSIQAGGITCLDHGQAATYLKDEEYKYLLWLFYSKLDQVDDFAITIDEKNIFRLLIDFAIEKTEMNRPQVLGVFMRFMLN